MKNYPKSSIAEKSGTSGLKSGQAKKHPQIEHRKLDTGTCKTDTDEFAPAFNQPAGPGTTGESHIGRQQTMTHPTGVGIGVGTSPYQRGTPRETSAPDKSPSPLNMQMILVKNQDEAAGLDSTHSGDGRVT